jgi:predicted nucleic acid-binding protein
MKILVDTNVFLDYLLFRDGSDEALEFFTLCRRMNHQIYITTMSLRDIGYSVHKAYHDEDAAKKAQLAAFNLCTKMIDINVDDALNSIYGDFKDFEDALQAEAAKRNLMDLIVTNNIKDFAKSSVPAVCVSRIVSVLKNYN